VGDVGAGRWDIAGLGWGVTVGGRVGAGNAAALGVELDLLNDVGGRYGLERVR
jgi:hypothetical protein